MLKKLLVAFTLTATATLVVAQKESSKPMIITYTISPASKLPENLLKYRSVLRTPLNPLTPEEELEIKVSISDEDKEKTALENARTAKFVAMEKSHLGISSGNRTAVTSNEDFLIVLETSDVKITYVNPAPMNELNMEDDVFRYSYSAQLTISDKNGAVLEERKLVNGEEEQKLTKAAIFFNPVYKVRANLAKNNPEKLKKLSDELMERKNVLVLNQVVVKADRALADLYEEQNKSSNVGVFSVKGKIYEELNEVSEKIFDNNAKFNALSKKNRLPKESMDLVWKDAIPVWEKYISEHKAEMEDQAYKGLMLDIALASTWLGDYEKAMTHLEAVPEAKKDESDPTGEDSPSPSGPGPSMMSFKGYATNVRRMYESFSTHKGRVVITQ